ncbi:MAG TPA: type II toxin-antitoxin system Phd/YefM family antitoxin [Kofleriaceae bacterium]|nr:type II toxin-antitoxin system Phd/YefM family antitoxin [Kofleriaceae bacterium]
MVIKDVKEISISEFKATCLALLKQVKRTGQPIVVTLRGEPLVEVVPVRATSLGRSWLGSARASGAVLGDLVSPTGEPWEALGGDR